MKKSFCLALGLALTVTTPLFWPAAGPLPALAGLALLGLAAVHFKRAETDPALKLWLEVLDEDPRNPVALRGMNLLRRGMSRDELQAFVDSGKLPQLYPRLPGRPLWPILLAVAAPAIRRALDGSVTRQKGAQAVADDLAFRGVLASPHLGLHHVSHFVR